MLRALRIVWKKMEPNTPDQRQYDYGKPLVESYNKIRPMLFSTNNPDAIYPRKLDETDATFPISIVGRTKNRIDDNLQDINEFTVDFTLAPPPGYFIKIHATPNLLLRGYMLACTPIINPKDEHSIIKVLLYKFRDSDDLELPFPTGLVGELCCANYCRIVRRISKQVDDTELRKEPTYNFNRAKEATQKSRSRGFFD